MTSKQFYDWQTSGGTDDSTVTLSCDSLSRLLEDVQAISDGSSSKVVSSNWQANDHRNGLVYPNGRELSYAFDDLDRYLQAGDVTNPSLSPVATYGYIGYRVLKRTYKNGTKLSYLNLVSGLDDGYDGLRRVVIQRHVDSANAIVAQFSHAYNRTNNRLNEIREHHLDGGLRVGEAYTYDSLYRLTNFQVGTFTAGGAFNAPFSSQVWQLDGVGNWSLFTDNGTPKTQAINSVNEYTAFASTANTFDVNKNLKDDGTFLYSFDFLNRLREVRRKSDNALIASYLYDGTGSHNLMGAGRRIRKVTTADSSIGATTTTYAYDGIMSIEERDSTDAILRQYVNGQRIDEHLSMDTYTSGSISSTYYYHENALGNVIALTDSTGAVVERYTYQAYGKPEFRDAANVVKFVMQSDFATPFLFNGQRYDPETELSYYRHRYLNHKLGRFVNRDPIGYEAGMSLFGYVDNSPTNNVDPLGLIADPSHEELKIGLGMTVIFHSVSLDRFLLDPCSAKGLKDIKEWIFMFKSRATFYQGDAVAGWGHYKQIANRCEELKKRLDRISKICCSDANAQKILREHLKDIQDISDWCNKIPPLPPMGDPIPLPSNLPKPIPFVRPEDFPYEGPMPSISPLQRVETGNFRFTLANPPPGTAQKLAEESAKAAAAWAIIRVLMIVALAL